MVEPEQDRDLARAKPGASSAIVRPLAVDTRGAGDVGRPERGIPLRRGGTVSAAGKNVRI